MFEPIGDSDLARVFSEAMVPGAYVHAHTADDVTPGRGAEFPPVPAYPCSVSAVFVSGDGTIRRMAIHGMSGDELQPSDSDLAGAYNRDVSELQALGGTVESSIHALLGFERVDPRFGWLGEWAIACARSAGRRLLAAHMVFEAIEGGQMYSSLTYPVEYATTFPLALRTLMIPALSLARAVMPEVVTEPVESFLRNEDGARRIAALPAAMLLPSFSDFETVLMNYHRIRP